MEFEITLPLANLRNALVAFSLFFVLTSFISFNMYMINLHRVTVQSLQGMASPLIGGFIAGEPQPTSVASKPPVELPTNSSGILKPPNNTSDCAPFHLVSRFEPTTNYRQSTNLPQWMKEYFDWHREQTSKINRCNFKDYKYLSVRCSEYDRKCGGVADRLKSLPFYVGTAAKARRILIIRWTRPAKLEEFLIPNEIDWSVPDWLYEELGGFYNTTDVHQTVTAKKINKAMKLPRRAKLTVIEGMIQDFYGASTLYYWLDSGLDENKELNVTVLENLRDMAGWAEYEEIFRDLFYTLFQPSPPVAKLVRDRMISANLIPGEFSACHYRAFYAVEHDKKTVTDESLIAKAENGFNCATFMQPGDPVYFASDSDVAVSFARNMSQKTGRKILTFDHKKEALHLDKMYQWKTDDIADFYPTFVDLLIMAESKCMSHGVGGYGAFANLLSIDPGCVIRHENSRANNMHRCNWHDTPPFQYW